VLEEVSYGDSSKCSPILVGLWLSVYSRPSFILALRFSTNTHCFCFDELIDWDDVYGFDMSVIKKQAYLEPLVDTVSADSVVTKAAKVMSVDIHTVKVEDLTWSSPFKISANRNDYVHAFVAYFDIEFSKCHKNVVFVTGPDNTYTHWKQTVFYLHDTITVNAGESITGHISVAPNPGNHRDLDITIKYDFDGTVHSLHETQEYRLR
jgi:protein arginine N-methyltransferase 1